MKPWHPNQKSANSTQMWNSSDTELSFQHMIKKPEHVEYFQQQGYNNITYRFNSEGFRGDEFATGGLLALGCSFTFGVGLPEETVWPYIVGKKLGLPVVNLSWGGNSLDGCFRMANYWLRHLRPELVVMLAPGTYRHELITEDRVITYVPEEQANYSQDFFIKQWTANDENAKLNSVKNKLAIAQICELNTAPLLMYDAVTEMSRSREEVGYARDYMHAGPKGHGILAEKILKDYNG